MKSITSALTVALVAMVWLTGTPADADLIGHWKFDEGTGTTTVDSSTNANTATQAGAAGSWIAGKADDAYELGLSTCRFELADSSDLQVTGAVTVSAWVNPTAASSYGLIAGIDQTGGIANDMYALKTDGSDKPYWAVIGPGTDVGLTASSTLAALAGSGWVHLVAVYDPTTGFAGLYTNGVLDVSTTTVPTSIQLKATDFQIGHNASDNGSYPLKAAVDDIQVYDQALSAAQVAYLYNNPGETFPAADADPVGWWKLNDGSGTTVADSSGNGYDLAQHNVDGNWTTGKAGGAYDQPRFTADATESDALNLAGGVTVSLSVWVTAYDSSTWGGIAGFDGTGTAGDIYSLKVNNDDTISWTVNGVAATSTIKLTDYTAGEWIHLVGVYDESSGSILYVNGVNGASATPTGGIVDKTTPGLFRIGTYYNSDSFEYLGSIDDVQLYEQALSAEQVADLYNNPGRAIPVVPAEAEPVGWWKLDDGSGANAVDASDNGYDLERVNTDGSWTTGKAGGAYDQPRFTADATESDALNLAGGVTVSLSVWVTAYDASTWAGIAGFEGTSTDGDIYSLKLNDDDTISWTVNGVAATSTIKLTDYTAGEWIHLVGVYDESSGSILYVNGVNGASATPTGGIVDKTTPGLFRIGTYYNNDYYEYLGSIDDVQLYAQALSARQVTKLYNNPGMTFPISTGTIFSFK